MSLANITLPVSHLPRSSSFFLSALQPLGYRYLDHRLDRHIGFGVEEPDFWLCQDNPEAQAGAADIAFSAPSRASVDAFYTAALRAGGSSHTPPTQRQNQYRAAVLDLDGNLVEVAWTETNDKALEDRRSLVGPARSTTSSRVLSWQKDVARTASDRQSVVAPSRVTARPEMPRAATTPIRPTEAKSSGADLSTAKALIGTLLGAAGGAAVAYAMMRAESEDELERERAASREPPTHQIMMIDREVDARRSEVGGARSIISGSGSRAPAPAPTIVVGSGSKVGSQALPTIQPTPAEQARTAIGTLISTFIPPSTVPRLLDAPPAPASTKPLTPAASAVGSSTSTAKPPRSSTSSSPATAITAREIPLPPSATASTVVTAREVPLPASSRTTAVSIARSIAGTVTPSESISNAGGSRKSKKSSIVIGGDVTSPSKVGSASGSPKPSSPSSTTSAKTEKTIIKPGSIVAGGGGGSSNVNGNGNGNGGGGAGSTTKSLPLRTGSTTGSASGKKSVVSTAAAGRPSPLRKESAT